MIETATEVEDRHPQKTITGTGCCRLTGDRQRAVEVKTALRDPSADASRVGS
jgi:hypothetical protein